MQTSAQREVSRPFLLLKKKHAIAANARAVSARPPPPRVTVPTPPDLPTVMVNVPKGVEVACLLCATHVTIDPVTSTGTCTTCLAELTVGNGQARVRPHRPARSKPIIGHY
jgi:hypothetical protein